MSYFKGKGAQYNPDNPYRKLQVSYAHLEGIDDVHLSERPKTRFYSEHPQKIISKNSSSDLSFEASINPYQGCEHGCTYCYARTTHEYWGFSAGLDFESKIITKANAAQLLEQEFLKPTWSPKTIVLSGNTDCYQPAERKLALTRSLLKVFLKYQHPVGIITKNALVTRDLDILKPLAEANLTYVLISITTLNEALRSKLEPRTSTASKKLAAIEALSSAGIPVGVMLAPIIPGLNQSEIPEILRYAAESGATFSGYTVVRLNGRIGEIFKDWLQKNYPDRADKVWNQMEDLHEGAVQSSVFGKRLKGSGKYAEMIKNLFEVSRRRYFGHNQIPTLSTNHFRSGGAYSLF